MGKKGGWFSAVKKALSPQAQERKKKSKSKNRHAENRSLDEVVSSEPPSEPVTAAAPSTLPPPQQPSPPPPPTLSVEETKPTEVADEDDQNRHEDSDTVSTAASPEASIEADQAAAEVVHLTDIPCSVSKSKEEIAAIKIQTAFRGYLARRALRALRGLVRLKSLIEGQSVKRQATTTLRCMQTLARVQSQIHSRRIRMSEENQALQRQLQLKHERELEKLKMGDIWNDSSQSKEQVEANFQSKQEAAMRRERALAYSFTHQQTRKNAKILNPTFMDPNNPNWGWSWLERWMAARPWEAKSTTEKEFNDHGSVKSFRSLSVAGEINRVHTLRDLSLDKKPSPTAQKSSRPPSRQSPSTPARSTSLTPGSGKAKPGNLTGNGFCPDDDAKSTMSIQSEQHRRHSIAGSSVRDNESLASSHAVRSYMASTKSAKARTKLPSPLGVAEKNGAPDQKQALGSAKKRLSFPASPGRSLNRRHSVPAKIEGTLIKDVHVHAEEILVSNGGSSWDGNTISQ